MQYLSTGFKILEFLPY